ncbi:MAG: RNA-guided endonuclease InsQ/TnpB family protein [Gemmatimonadota bacterium]
MSRYRLVPSPSQEAVLREHCAHARFVWNLAVEQQSWWRPGRKCAPGYLEQCRQLTSARAEHPWLAEGSQTVQQQALRDFSQAMRNYFAGTHRQPTWRKAGRHEGFRVVAVKPAHVRRLSRKMGEVLVPKAGWVRFRWSRAVPAARSYRVTRDRAGRWHIAFASAPKPIPGPQTGETVGIDRGVAVTLALSDGATYQAPVPRAVERAQRRLSRARRGSNRRARLKARLARLHARNADARKDWAEKRSTEIARRYDVIRIEDLKVRNMTRSARGTIENPGRNVRQKAWLNRAILASGWSLFATRLEDKAAGRVEKVSPAYTSQTCSQCGIVDRKARESQAVFRCRSCGYCGNADVNAARNIAAGHAVTARGGPGLPEPVNREPQLLASSSGGE